MSNDNPIAPEKRIAQLTDDDETLLSYLLADSTSKGTYAPVIREWQHPNDPDARILAERYAYLTHGDGSDGWTDEGINRRIPAGADPAEFCKTIGRAYLAAAARLEDTDETHEPQAFDVRPEGDR